MPASLPCPLTHRPCPQPPPVIDRFFGRYIWLSNFYYVPITLEGHVYPTVEHAYQAGKTLSLRWRERVRRCPTPKDAKRVGRRVPLRPDWYETRLSLMETLIRQKFNPHLHPDLAQKLRATGDAPLIEGNTWGDRFWGVERRSGRGDNHLGRILMQVRAELTAKGGLD